MNYARQVFQKMASTAIPKFIIFENGKLEIKGNHNKSRILIGKMRTGNRNKYSWKNY
jgi:hypothetical protein